MGCNTKIMRGVLNMHRILCIWHQIGDFMSKEIKIREERVSPEEYLLFEKGRLGFKISTGMV